MLSLYAILRANPAYIDSLYCRWLEGPESVVEREQFFWECKDSRPKLAAKLRERDGCVRGRTREATATR